MFTVWQERAACGATWHTTLYQADGALYAEGWFDTRGEAFLFALANGAFVQFRQCCCE
jgi:hypothetical protein